MSEQEVVAQEATPEAVQSDESQTPEVVDSTKGQVNDQPGEGEQPEQEEVSKSKARRERRKAELAQLRQSAEEAEAKAAEQEKRLQAIQDAANSQRPPDESQFTDYNDYLIAQAAYQSMAALDKRQIQEIEREREQQQQQIEATKQQQEAVTREAWGEQVADAKARYADFDQVVMNNPTLPINETMAQVIQASDKGADVAYHLGTNPQVAAQISQMAPLDAARAIGALEAQLSLPKPRTNTTAPEPIAPVSPKASAGSKDPDKMTMAEYKAWRAGKS